MPRRRGTAKVPAAGTSAAQQPGPDARQPRALPTSSAQETSALLDQSVPIEQSAISLQAQPEPEEDSDDEAFLGQGDTPLRCQDTLCCFVFLLYITVMVLLGLVTMGTGDIDTLLHAVDYKGYVCGSDDMVGKPYGFYPRLSEDALYASETQSDCAVDPATGSVPLTCKINLFTVCVTLCPAAGDIVCNYEREAELSAVANASDRSELERAYATERKGCWWVPATTAEYAERCITYPPDVATEVHTFCDVHGENGTITSTEIPATEHSYCRGSVRTVSGTTESEISGSKAQTEELLKLNSAMALFSDLLNSWGLILFCGAIVACGCSVLLVLGWLADKLLMPLVIAVLALLGVVLLATTSVCFIQYGSFFGFPLDKVQLSGKMQVAVGPSEDDSELAAEFMEEGESSFLWAIPAYGGLVASVLYVLAVIFARKQFKLVVGVIGACNDAMRKLPMIGVYPFIATGLVAAMTLYGILIVILLPSADMSVEAFKGVMTGVNYDVDHDSIELEVEKAEKMTLTMQTTIATPPPLEYDPDSGGDDWLVTVALIYHVFGVIWVVQFVLAFVTVATASAVCKGYRSMDEDGDGDVDVSKCAACIGIWETLRYHSGSVALGSLVLTVVKPVQLPFEFVLARMRVTKEDAQRSVVRRLVKTVGDCVGKCYEKLVKYLTHSAYVLMGVRHDGFFQSSWTSFRMITKSEYRIERVQSNMSTVFTMAIIALSGTSALMFLLIVSTAPAFSCKDKGIPVGCETEGSNFVAEPAGPTFVTAVLAFLVSSSFMSVYSVTADTMIFCFIEEDNAKNSPVATRGQSWAYKLLAKAFKDHSIGFKTPEEIRKDRARRQGGPLLLPSFGLSALDPRQWCCCKKKATEHAKLEGEDLP